MYYKCIQITTPHIVSMYLVPVHVQAYKARVHFVCVLGLGYINRGGERRTYTQSQKLLECVCVCYIVGADIDTLLVAPRHIDRSEFFSSFLEMLQQEKVVTNIRVSLNAIYYSAFKHYNITSR